MTLKNNRAPVLSIIKLCASFHHHMWIQTEVTVRKPLSWVLTSVTLTFDLWPWPFAWTFLWSLVITPENSMMMRLWEHCKKCVTDRQTDRQTEIAILTAAWSQLKNRQLITNFIPLNCRFNYIRRKSSATIVFQISRDRTTKRKWQAKWWAYYWVTARFYIVWYCQSVREFICP